MELKIKGISKSYSDTLAVDNFNTNFSPGVYGFLGANGAGKTTVIKILCNILKPTSGIVSYNGEKIEKLSNKYRSQIGYLPQDFGYYPHFTAFSFLLYISALKGIDDKAAKVKTNELLPLVGLEEYRNRKIKTFSGGMKQRLGIAQAMLNDPKILILDEPTTGLDPKERIHFRNLISSFSKDKIVLLSTHIVSDIASIANEILIMKKGKLIVRGTINELLTTIENKVWQCSIDRVTAEKIKSDYIVINMTLSDDLVNLRIISDTCPFYGSILENANLEDLYLYYFREVEHIDAKI
ncbi:MAG: ABC transporter ATP-binding protein [Clostridiales bacterium GWF2_38_85]|nr:MAG: ABC transporter ATP-binding protein [Clostridiales bacterium GWF2_38_85]HBL83365.1 ABC transporter ATP-binding protein [Clostridiales bacterium]